MATTIAFLAQTPGSASIEHQRACLQPDDVEVLAGRKTFNQLSQLLALEGINLKRGDRVKVYDLSCLSLVTPMLIRAITKLLGNGISFEIWALKIVIDPSSDNKLPALLEALDSHYRHVHGIKTHPVEMSSPGRKRLLDPEKLGEILKKLDAPGATATEVAQELGVARTTLFNYLERYDVARRAGRGKKGVNRGSENIRDDRYVAERERGETTI